MKKTLSLFIAVCLVLSLFTGVFVSMPSAQAASEGGFTYSIVGTAPNQTATITKYTGAGGAVVIPSTLGGYPVTSIGDYAFDHCSSLTSVTIPNSVTSLGNAVFFGCTGLTSITIPNSVTSIGHDAFADCSALTSITVDPANGSYSSIDGVLFNKTATLLIQYPGGKQGAYVIPNSVTSIGDGAFVWCSSLSSITIPNSVTSIGSQAFGWCSSLTGITIPNSVTSVSNYAFGSCTGLTSVTIPSSVTSIGQAPFDGCSALTSITVDPANGSYSSIDGVLFNKTAALLIQYPGGKQGAYVIPNSVTSIGSQAFADCSSVTSVIIPDSVTSIGDWALYGCSALTSVTIGNGVTSIGMEAFQECRSLASATIPDSVTHIGSQAFAYCWKLTAAYFLGNAPTGTSDMFDSCASGFTVYYVSGTTGWSNPWYGYPTATFVPGAHTLTITASPLAGGTVTRSPDETSYPFGTVVTLTASANSGYTFNSWTGATPVTGHPDQATVTMDADKTVTAAFTINTYTITASAGVNGTIAPSGSVSVPYGSSQSFTITPNLGYMIDTLTVDNVPVNSATNQLGYTETLTNVVSSHVISVTFKQIPDTQPPTVTLPDFGTFPGVSGYSGGSVPTFWVSTSPFNVEFTLDDNRGPVKWTISVNGAVVIDPVGIGSITYPVLLSEGRNDVVISARDAAGNATSKELIVYLDSMNPVLTLTPTLPASVTTPQLTITGSVADTGSGLKRFTINGTEVIPFLDGSFSEKLLLTKGANTIVLEAEDNVGHKVTSTYTVTYATAGTSLPTAKTVTLTIGKTTMDVNGMAVALDAAPVLQNGRTLLPIRALIEVLGGKVTWNATTRAAIVTLNGRTVSVTIGNPIGLVGGKKVPIDAANAKVVPIIINGRTFLPLRFIADNLGLDLTWEPVSRTISFTYWP